ncbi:MAG: DUF2497 domain-containing protein [Rhodospirillales bacterium]
MSNPSRENGPDTKRSGTASADTATADQQEPSMEDILTSIRRILSEDGGEETAGARTAEERAGPLAPAPVPESPGAIASRADARPEVEEDTIEPDPEPGPEPRPAAAREVVLEDAETISPAAEADDVLVLSPDMRVPLVSAAATTASTDVLNQLAKAILDRRDIAIGGREVTLEGMVREMLRPLLKEWLDRNLPYLIERLVKKEIDLMINRAERLDD